MLLYVYCPIPQKQSTQKYCNESTYPPLFKYIVSISESISEMRQTRATVYSSSTDSWLSKCLSSPLIMTRLELIQFWNKARFGEYRMSVVISVTFSGLKYYLAKLECMCWSIIM